MLEPQRTTHFGERKDGSKVPFTLSHDGKCYTTPRGMITIRAYRGFDPNDLLYSHKVCTTNEELDKLIRTEVALHQNAGKYDQFVRTEQGERFYFSLSPSPSRRIPHTAICDAYVNIIEIAKDHLPSEDCASLIEQLKELRYQYVRKCAHLQAYLIREEAGVSTDL